MTELHVRVCQDETLGDRSLGFWVKCRACAHCWIAAYFPAPVEIFVKAAKDTRCPKCAAAKPVVAKQNNGVLLEDPADTDIATALKRLTPAQRRFLTGLSRPDRAADASVFSCRAAIRNELSTCHALMKQGIVRKRPGSGAGADASETMRLVFVGLTELGIAVMQQLQVPEVADRQPISTEGEVR